MDFIRRRVSRLGHGARSPYQHRPRIGRTALVTLALLGTGVLPPAARAADEPQGRVVNGTAVQSGDVSASGRWSAVVAIFATDAQGTRLCTGTLVAPNWVATAAHCIAQTDNATQPLAPADVVVAPGITSISNAGDHLVDAVSTHVHPGFSWTNASWDSALIELATTIPATPFALPDPLRASTYVVGNLENVAGFGRSQPSNSASSGVLRSGRLEQVNAAACAAYNPGSGDYADCYQPGTTRQATCFGDSGGPLIRFDSTQGNAPVLWGITSTGPDPCDAATGGAFAPAFETRVIAVKDWLTATMSGSTYVPSPPATVRTAGNAGTSTPTTGGGSSGSRTRSPAGGTGIGIFQTKIGRAPTARRAGKVTLSASFVGATGTGDLEIERCKRSRCKIVSTSTVTFAAAARTVKATVPVPRCAKGIVYNLRLTVNDAAGNQRDTAAERVARCG